MSDIYSNGYNDQIKEDEKIKDVNLPLSFSEKRHVEVIEGIACLSQTWRMKERMKTVSVALVLCLNVGVDPPDVVKTQPCARLECWIDPLSMSPTKALEAIGANLQKQYERWQPRARYKQSLDPTAEEVKKLCMSLRRNAKEERVLFHYNGHGVPKPTSNGEIWVFNRAYTQYIPLSIYDLQSWMGSPSIYVYDCSNAGIIVDSFKQFAIQHENEYESANQGRGSSPAPPSFRNCIQLAACSANQVLPMNPDLPADLFTSCLTTPIKIALRWFIMKYTSKLVPQVTLDLIDNIPGQLTDRRTMLGELNWIFTAITDTIAWNTLPKELFQKLFRQDLLVASLFRNFLLAERVMRSYDCTPVSSPSLPATYQHPMWQAWDLALDLSLGQLPRIIKDNEPFEHLPFFEEQLTAFQVWLELGSEERSPPEQLPIVLQVLLSQIHRMRALELLGKFLDFGPWAVNLALSVGIFPYVLKLLQSCAKELRPLLVFIWAKILAVDNTCQADLVRERYHNYFLSVLQDPAVTAEHRTQAAFVLACIVNDYREGQEAALQGSLVSICLEQLSDTNPQLRQWVAICLGRLWDHYEKARWTGVRDIAHEKLYTLLQDPCPEVRAAVVYALGTFINSVSERSDHANNIDHSVVMTLLNTVSVDMSTLVRKELVVALQWVVLAFEHVFCNVAAQENITMISSTTGAGDTPINHTTSLKRTSSRSESESNDKMKRVASSSSIYSVSPSLIQHNHTGSLGTLPSIAYGSVYSKIWRGLCNLESDPDPDVAKMCSVITNYVRNQIKNISQQAKEACEKERICSSLSLPPSPNKNTYLSGESPPTLHINTDLQRFATSRSAMSIRARKLFQPNTISEENDGIDCNIKKSPLVTTSYVAWASKFFAKPILKKKVEEEDVESLAYYEKQWRLERNAKVRKESIEEQKKLTYAKLESQVFNAKCAVPPTVLQFHPYDQQIAVSGKDSFAIWDWGKGAKILSWANKSNRIISKITSLEWVNAHDVALLMVGSDDGSIRLWRPVYNFNREPVLVTAWNTYIEPLPTLRHNSSKLLLVWEQWTESVIATGDSRVLQFWDAECELRAFDIPTGADCPITCLDSTFASTCHERCARFHSDLDPCDDGLYMGVDDHCDQKLFQRQRTGIVFAGCADGSVRLFDRRCSPNEALVKTWMEHGAEVLGLIMRNNVVISGSKNGDVRIFDIRKNKSLASYFNNNSEISSLSIHRNCGIYASGSAQSISVCNFNGQLQSVIRLHESFMGYKNGPFSCLSFHPYRVVLAAGTVDSYLSVYTLEHRR